MYFFAGASFADALLFSRHDILQRAEPGRFVTSNARFA
jgi:hypothetical protein